MNNNLRIRTDIGKDKYLKVNLEQDFDFLEILSLKISQEDVYRRFNANYGVVVGRVIVNNGLGVPNAKVSVFIPINDSESTNLKSLYPFKTINDKDSDGIRYNGLPKEYQSDCHTPVGTFPNKREVLDNDIVFEMYDKYYKFTTTTNDAGDFMLFGIPVGNHMLNVDVDLSDIGIFSQKPYDLMREGSSENLFDSSGKFKESENLDTLAQIKTRELSVEVYPFWGDLDYIGIDGYFPVSDLKTPTVEACKIGLERWKKEVKSNHERYNKPILFTEFGYRSVNFTGKEPWRSDGYLDEVNLEAQTNATQAFFDTFWNEDWIAGGFIWKWFHNHEKSGGKEDNQFTPQNKPVEVLIKTQYSENY